MLVATHLSVLVVDHDIVWLDVSVHDPHTVTVVQGLQIRTSQQLTQELKEIPVCRIHCVKNQMCVHA